MHKILSKPTPIPIPVISQCLPCVWWGRGRQMCLSPGGCNIGSMAVKNDGLIFNISVKEK